MHKKSYRYSAAIIALTASAAIGMTTAKADELSDLKQQLQQLESRVDQLSSTHQVANQQLPAGASYLTINRGSTVSEEFAHLLPATDLEAKERGVTFAVTPTADLPAPTAEITVYGYTKGTVIYDFDQDLGDQLNGANMFRNGHSDHVRLHARASRFGIRSKVDTAIGQIRTLIEGDFFSGGNNFRARHAWGEWDMTPNWTFGAGQTWSNYMILFDGGDQVDFYGIYGRANTRQAQVRLTYKNAGWQFSVAAENPNTRTVNAAIPANAAGYRLNADDDRVPDFTARIAYDMHNGAKFAASAMVGEGRIVNGNNGYTNSDSDARWGVTAGAQIPVFDQLTLTASGGYGSGNGRYINGTDADFNVFGFGGGSDKIAGRKFFHANVSASYDINETTTLNADWGYIDYRGKDTFAGQTNNIMGLHGNIMWRPVKQMKMGWEVSYVKRSIKSNSNADNLRAQFATWFYF